MPDHPTSLTASRWRRRLLVYGTLFALLAISGISEQLFYLPSQQLTETPDSVGQAFESVHFESSDGKRLHGWFLKTRQPPRATVIHFHGNAANIANHYRFVEKLTHSGYQVLVFDYRGYGQSEGRPSRKGLQADAAAAIAYTLNRPDVNEQQVFLLGQSIGVTAMLAGWSEERPQVAGMVLDSGFRSYHAIAGDALKQSPLTAPLSLLTPIMIRDGIDAEDVLPTIPHRIPLLLQHGEADRVIPPRHSQYLRSLASGGAELITYPNADHLEAPFQLASTYQQDLLLFFERCLAK